MQLTSNYLSLQDLLKKLNRYPLWYRHLLTSLAICLFYYASLSEDIYSFASSFEPHLYSNRNTMETQRKITTPFIFNFGYWLARKDLRSELLSLPEPDILTDLLCL